jgi:signal transduction histidine kinase
MIFMLGTIYLDRSSRMLNSNIIYIMSVSLIMFAAYLLSDYVIKAKYIKKLLQFETAKDKTPIFPEPMDYKDEVYAGVLLDLFDYYNTSLKDMGSQFKENNDFMTAWVHEIKTPITTSKLLMDNSANSSDFLSSLDEEINKIDDYVEKVLYYSRGDNFSEDYIIAETALSALIKESVKKHSIIFIRKHISFINEVEGSFLVDTDRKWLLFIVDQILSNALKYTGANGIIKCSAYENDKEKVLVIEDTGTGIKKEDIDRVFQKSFTGNNGRNINSKATGLGLYLSYKLAKKLGHDITLQSQYGSGTSVCVHFPKWNDYYITKM